MRALVPVKLRFWREDSLIRGARQTPWEALLRVDSVRLLAADVDTESLSVRMPSRVVEPCGTSKCASRTSARRSLPLTSPRRRRIRSWPVAPDHPLEAVSAGEDDQTSCRPSTSSTPVACEPARNTARRSFRARPEFHRGRSRRQSRCVAPRGPNKPFAAAGRSTGLPPSLPR